jgi:hypothetical protein
MNSSAQWRSMALNVNITISGGYSFLEVTAA